MLCAAGAWAGAAVSFACPEIGALLLLNRACVEGKGQSWRKMRAGLFMDMLACVASVPVAA